MKNVPVTGFRDHMRDGDHYRQFSPPGTFQALSDDIKDFADEFIDI